MPNTELETLRLRLVKDGASQDLLDLVRVIQKSHNEIFEIAQKALEMVTQLTATVTELKGSHSSLLQKEALLASQEILGPEATLSEVAIYAEALLADPEALPETPANHDPGLPSPARIKELALLAYKTLGAAATPEAIQEFILKALRDEEEKN